ncbi:hypothetical protein CVU75_00280, partial [Candidatus Dependentiae bacterium HGW-Dependentiae-1]
MSNKKLSFTLILSIASLISGSTLAMTVGQKRIPLQPIDHSTGINKNQANKEKVLANEKSDYEQVQKENRANIPSSQVPSKQSFNLKADLGYNPENPEPYLEALQLLTSALAMQEQSVDLYKKLMIPDNEQNKGIKKQLSTIFYLTTPFFETTSPLQAKTRSFIAEKIRIIPAIANSIINDAIQQNTLIDAVPAHTIDVIYGWKDGFLQQKKWADYREKFRPLYTAAVEEIKLLIQINPQKLARYAYRTDSPEELLHGIKNQDLHFTNKENEDQQKTAPTAKNISLQQESSDPLATARLDDKSWTPIPPISRESSPTENIESISRTNSFTTPEGSRSPINFSEDQDYQDVSNRGYSGWQKSENKDSLRFAQTKKNLQFDVLKKAPKNNITQIKNIQALTYWKNNPLFTTAINNWFDAPEINLIAEYSDPVPKKQLFASEKYKKAMNTHLFTNSDQMRQYMKIFHAFPKQIDMLIPHYGTITTEYSQETREQVLHVRMQGTCQYTGELHITEKPLIRGSFHSTFTW